MKIVFTQEEMKKLLEACKILCSDNKCNPDKLNVVNIAIESDKVIAYATDRYQLLKVTFNDTEMIKEASDIQNRFIVGYKVVNLYERLSNYFKKTNTSIANIYIIDTNNLDFMIVNNIPVYVKDILVLDNIHVDITKYKNGTIAPQALIQPYSMLKLAKILKAFVNDIKDPVIQKTCVVGINNIMSTEWGCENYKIEMVTTLCSHYRGA